MADIYLDLETGNDANNGANYANRVLTPTRAAALMADGDDVRAMASSTPNSLGVNGTFVRGSTQINLASAVNVTLDQGESAWTASANVTCTTSTTRKQGATSASIAIATGFATGLLAYKALGLLTDLSGYQQISFWMQQTAGTLAANVSIRICTDTIGAVSVNTFTIPAVGALNAWHRVVINLGSAMSAVAQSIAVYADSDQGAQTFLIDNLVACKAPGTGELTHKTLIGTGNSLGAGGNDSGTWYPIREITGTTITLEAANSSTPATTSIGMFWGTSETVTAYSMLPSYLPVGVVTADVLFFKSGTSGNHLSISGGWNRTDMSTQTGHTWAAMPNSTSITPTFFGGYIDWEKLHFVLITSTIVFNVSNSTVDQIHFISTASVVFVGSSIDVSKVVSVNSSTVLTISCADSTFSDVVMSSYASNAVLSTSNAIGCTIVISVDSNNLGGANTGNVVTYNGVTYGLNGPDAIADLLSSDFSSAQSVLDKLDDTVEDDGGTYRFTTNALEQAPSGGGGGSAPTVTEIADEVQARELTAKVTRWYNQGDDEYAYYPDSFWSSLTKLDTLIEYAVTPFDYFRFTQQALSLAASQASVDDLPTVAEFEARTLAAANYATAANLATVAGYLDTEIADIKAKTDNLPSDPADASDIAASFSTVNSTLATLATTSAATTNTSTISAAIAAVQADTDNIQTRIPAALTADGNIKSDALKIGGATPNNLAAGAQMDLVNAPNATAITAIQSGIATAAALAELAAKFTGITLLKNWLGSLLGKTADTGTRAEINATTAGATYNETTDSLQAIRDRGDSAWGSAGNVDVASFTAGALEQLAALDNINVVGGRVRNGVLLLQVGDAYNTDDGTQLSFTNSIGSWPELTDATITSPSTAIGASIDVDGEVIVATGANQRVDVEMTESESLALKAGKWKYELIAELTSGNRSTIESGFAEVSGKI